MAATSSSHYSGPKLSKIQVGVVVEVVGGTTDGDLDDFWSGERSEHSRAGSRYSYAALSPAPRHFHAHFLQIHSFGGQTPVFRGVSPKGGSHPL